MKKQIVISFILISLLASTAHSMNSCMKYNPPNNETFPTFCFSYDHPLIEAIQNNDHTKVKTLLEQDNADPNKRNCGGCTPLSFAINNELILNLLLEREADPNASSCSKSLDYWKELDRAIALGTKESVIKLLQFGADPFDVRKEHKKVFWQNTEEKNKNIQLVQAERKTQFFHYLWCQQKTGLFLPIEMRKEIFYAMQGQSYTEILEDNLKSHFLQ